MRCVERNKVPVYYALYRGVQELQDADGNYTGEYQPLYSDVICGFMNVSPANGRSEWTPFGDGVSYSKIIVTDELNTGITTTSVMWLDLPVVETYDDTFAYSVGDICLYAGKLYECIANVGGEPFNSAKWRILPFNYEVKKVAQSKHYVSFAVSEVDVRE